MDLNIAPASRQIVATFVGDDTDGYDKKKRK